MRLKNPGFTTMDMFVPEQLVPGQLLEIGKLDPSLKPTDTFWAACLPPQVVRRVQIGTLVLYVRPIKEDDVIRLNNRQVLWVKEHLVVVLCDETLMVIDRRVLLPAGTLVSHGIMPG